MGNLAITELVEHPLRWVEIDRFISKPSVTEGTPGTWDIDGKLRMQVFGSRGEIAKDGINGTARRDFSAKAGEVFSDSVCVYHTAATGGAKFRVNTESVEIGLWRIQRDVDGHLVISEQGTANIPR